MFSKVISFSESSSSPIKSEHSHLDFIGDVHGYYDELVGLLKKMNYKKNNSIWQHPERKAVFVGDFVSRGPHSRKVLELVKSMVENQKGYAILGNHELNMIGYFTFRKNGNPIASLARTNQMMLEQISKQFESEEELEKSLKWLKRLPFYIDFTSVRVVHAYWGESTIRIINSIITEGKLTKDHIKEIFKGNTEFAKAVWQTTRGIEIDLPKDLVVKDSKNVRRTNFRIKWWEEPINKTFRSISFGNRFLLPEYTIPKELLSPFDVYPQKAPLVIFGHYCLGKESLTISSNICCIDSCVAGSGHKLTAYRWQGEKEVKPEHLISYVVPSS